MTEAMITALAGWHGLILHGNTCIRVHRTGVPHILRQRVSDLVTSADLIKSRYGLRVRPALCRLYLLQFLSCAYERINDDILLHSLSNHCIRQQLGVL